MMELTLRNHVIILSKTGEHDISLSLFCYYSTKQLYCNYSGNMEMYGMTLCVCVGWLGGGGGQCITYGLPLCVVYPVCYV